MRMGKAWNQIIMQCFIMPIFVEALEEFPNLFIQSETGASTHEYSESFRATKYVMLLSNFEDEHRGFSPVSEAGLCLQLVFVPPTEPVHCIHELETTISSLK